MKQKEVVEEKYNNFRIARTGGVKTAEQYSGLGDVTEVNIYFKNWVFWCDKSIIYSLPVNNGGEKLSYSGDNRIIY